MKAQDTWSRSGVIDPPDRFLALAETAPSEDRKRQSLFAHALVLAERGEAEAAAVFFHKLEVGKDRIAAEAAYERSRRQETWTQPETRRQRLVKLIKKYPDTIASERFLVHLIGEYRDQGEHKALLAVLKEIQANTSQTHIESRLLFETAMHANHHLQERALALATYATLYNKNPRGPLADDALWEMAVIYGQLQMWNEHIDLLKRLDRTNESSWFVGNYRSGWQHKARYRLGLVHLLFLEDHVRAREYFTSYLTDFPDNTLADDAAWNLVEIRRLDGRDDYAEHQELFVGSFPWSRHVRHIRTAEGNTP